MRPEHDETGLQYAEVAARRGTCLRRKVGCCLTNHRNQVVATGYNGRAAGQPHCNEPTGFNFIYTNGIDKKKPLEGQSTGREDVFANACAGAKAPSGAQLDACEAIHAEQNALLQCGDVYQIQTCYVTVSPCITCVKLLMNTSCKRIVFREKYAHDEAARKLWITSEDREWILLPG